MRINGQLKPQLGLTLGDIPAERRDSLADHAQIEVKADARDVTRLLAAEQVACSANLEVF